LDPKGMIEFACGELYLGFEKRLTCPAHIH